MHDPQLCNLITVSRSVRPLWKSSCILNHRVYLDQLLHMYACQHFLTTCMLNILLLSICPAGRGQLLKMLTTFEPHGKFGSNFAFLLSFPNEIGRLIVFAPFFLLLLSVQSFFLAEISVTTGWIVLKLGDTRGVQYVMKIQS